MMWHTHAAVGASTAWLLLPLVPPDGLVNIGVVAAFCAEGALVPDLDAAESKIKHIKVVGAKPLVPMAIAVHRNFGHRGFLHSVPAWVLWTLLLSPVSTVTDWLPVAGLSLGYASHLAGDACTRSGIALLYPQEKRYHPLPRCFRLVTGSQAEEVLFVIAAAMVTWLLLGQLHV